LALEKPISADPT